MPEPTPTLADPEDSDALRPEPLAAALADLRAQLSASQRQLAESREALRSSGAREQVLAHELQHRIRNMLAVLRSIYRRTRERGASQDEFAEHFQGRFDAIARYQAEIFGFPSSGIELEDMVRDALLDVHCLEGPKCTIAGPLVRLRHKAAEMMGLALHELATNSIKFGALYHGGSLSVAWSLTGTPEHPTLEFRWTEANVPLLAAAPQQKGFGRDLIEEALPYELGATTSFDIRSDGFACSIVLPLPLPAEPFPADGQADAAAPFFASDAE